MQLTHEQEAVCESNARTLLVNAYAGCGKTSTLEVYARRRPRERFLYLAFNRAIKDEAEKKFPGNVKCVTTHGLAFPRFGAAYQKKLGNVKPYHVAKPFAWDIVSAGRALDVVTAFLASADTDIGEEHVRRTSIPSHLTGQAIDAAKLVWKAMCDTGNPDVPMPHDGYLKLYQASNPVINTDVILFDEAQDAAPAIHDIVRNQRCRRVVVGDRYQGIYGWRGAINAMEEFLSISDAQFHLTSSFRFGNGIADLASAVLADWRGERKPLRGLGRHPTEWGVNESEPHTIIARTNAGLFDAAVKQLIAKRPFGLVGGVASYKLDLVLDAYHLYAGGKSLIRDPFLKSFEDWASFNLYAETLDDRECKTLIRVVDTYGREIPSLIERIKADARNELQGDEVLLVTGHKSKGLEWERVVLLDDFTRLEVQANPESGEIIRPDAEEVNLIYVATTRALKALHVNDNIVNWLRAEHHHQLLYPILAGFKRSLEPMPEQRSGSPGGMGQWHDEAPSSFASHHDSAAGIDFQSVIGRLRAGRSLTALESGAVAQIVEKWYANEATEVFR